MIDGGHVVIYSKDAQADRAFFRDVLKFGFVDAHAGWLIFKLPPSEVAVHPAAAVPPAGAAPTAGTLPPAGTVAAADDQDRHELFLMTDDLDGEMVALGRAGVRCDAPTQQAWGRMTRITLPGGGKLGLYQPRHARP
jgi:catechol 2,3-dioxygenase-like lactoylglutathione lyase family enzyme